METVRAKRWRPGAAPKACNASLSSATWCGMNASESRGIWTVRLIRVPSRVKTGRRRPSPLRRPDGRPRLGSSST